MKTIKFSLILLAFMAFAQTTWAQLPCLPDHGRDDDVTAWCGITQETLLSAGWNWFSTYIAVEDSEEAMLMLQEALGENGLQIKSRRDGYTTYEDGEWGAMGTLEEIENVQMYMIHVANACTVVLQGEPTDPEDYTIVLRPGWNWIGFPSTAEIELEAAFGDFEPTDGDQIKSRRNGFSTYEDGEWGAMGTLETLLPGQGYMYYNASNSEKQLVLLSGAKAKRHHKQ